MARLVINGRRTVSGVHRVQGNKNAALPMIAAALLSPEPVTLENVPEIEDVAMMLEAARSFGAKISRDLAAGTATISAPRIRTARIAPELAAKIR
ncbi:MAG: UDP-N-acetylglucosamine 1-carboxyvinyltransferase, partial [Kiritimatiellae bacterium]|nr:UDP-N-acetylglucosamine 1-carboxyvinyltransferase [Kiritimatiellia bacterium]